MVWLTESFSGGSSSSSSSSPSSTASVPSFLRFSACSSLSLRRSLGGNCLQKQNGVRRGGPRIQEEELAVREANEPAQIGTRAAARSAAYER